MTCGIHRQGCGLGSGEWGVAVGIRYPHTHELLNVNHSYRELLSLSICKQSTPFLCEYDSNICLSRDLPVKIVKLLKDSLV